MIDKSLIERLFRTHYAKMYSLARTILHDEEESKDVVQEIFVHLMNQNMIPDKEVPFLLTCVRNRCFDLLSHKQMREKVEKLILLESEKESYPLSNEEPSFNELLRYVDNEMELQTQNVFRLRFAEDMKYLEIATELDISQKTVYKHLKLAVNKLKLHFNVK